LHFILCSSIAVYSGRWFVNFPILHIIAKELAKIAKIKATFANTLDYHIFQLLSIPWQKKVK